MGSVNTINPNVDNSVRIFDGFNDFVLEVDSNTYSVVNSFFESIFTNKQAAANLSDTFFRIATQTNIPVLDLLAQVQGQDSIQVTTFMAYYLNGLRSPSTLIGVNAVATPNYYTARNVAL
jgi:hypothetical protein